MEETTFEEFIKDGEKRFGKNKKKWRFRCISCGEVQCGEDFIKQEVKDPSSYPHFSCIGRFDKNRGCNWTLGGLFTIHEKAVISPNGKTPVFNFEGEPYNNKTEARIKKGKNLSF